MRVIPNQPDQQVGIPGDQRQAMAKVDAMLIKAGVTTPKELAVLLDDLRPDGSLRKYSQALWNCLSMAQPALSGVHDWTAFYRGDSEGSKMSPAERIRQLEAELERVKAAAVESECNILRQASDMLNQANHSANTMTEELHAELSRIRRDTSSEIQTLKDQLADVRLQNESLEPVVSNVAQLSAQLVEAQTEREQLRAYGQNAKSLLDQAESRLKKIQSTTLNVMIAIHIGLSLAWPWVFIKEESLWSSNLDATTLERWIWSAASLAGWGITELIILLKASSDSAHGFLLACLCWMTLGFVYLAGMRGEDVQG